MEVKWEVVGEELNQEETLGVVVEAATVEVVEAVCQRLYLELASGRPVSLG